MRAHFGRHPDAEIYLSQPGIGPVLGARVLGEFGDDPGRYASGKARKNYAATSPITRASGKKKVVAARFIRNDRLTDALMAQALSAISASPGARALYDAERDRGTEHNPALRKLANRLVGILHGCLKTRTPYDEATAWPQQGKPPSIRPRSLTFKLLGCLSGQARRPVCGQLYSATVSRARSYAPAFLLPFRCRRWLLEPSCSRHGIPPAAYRRAVIPTGP